MVLNSINKRSLALAIVLIAIFKLGFSQHPSEEFEVITNLEISVSEKKKKFDSLLASYKSNGKLELLINDRYELLKWYFQQNDIEKTLALNRQNLKLMDSLVYEDLNTYRKNTYSLGYYLMLNKQDDEASKIFNSLLGSEVSDTFTYNAYYNIAQMSYNAEDYYLSAEQFENGLAIAKNENNLAYTIAYSLGAGYAYKVIKTNESLNKGIKLIKAAIVLLDNNSKQESYSDKYNFYNLYDLLGSLYNDRDDYNFDLSLNNYSKAETYAIELKDSLRLANINNNIGYLYLQDKRDAAISYFKKALTYKPDITTKSIIHRNKAEYYLNTKDKLNALQSIQESIQVLTPIDVENLETLPDKSAYDTNSYKFLLLSSIVDKARIWLDLSDYMPYNKTESFENALLTLKDADGLVDIIRFQSNDNKSKLYWRETASNIYLNATKACYELNKAEEAFYFMEKNKALLLLEDVNKRNLLKASAIPESISKREKALNDSILKYSKHLNHGDDLFKAKENYRIYIDSLGNDYLLYYKTQGPAKVVTLNDARSSLNDKQAYVEYIIGSSNGYGLIVTKYDLEFYIIKNCETLKKNVKDMFEILKKPFKDSSDEMAYSQLSNTIYKTLFPKNTIDIIKGKSLTIVPDYYLQNIPFEALNTTEDINDFMIYDHEINYTYSISLLKNKRHYNTSKSNGLIGFAPVEFQNLSSLKHTRSELSQIGAILDADMYLHEEATKTKFLNTLERYSMLHIASHANAKINHTDQPWIAFYDNKLDLQELYRLNHNLDLVVLSACETSLGDLYKGEGIMSLSRGFINTGANSVISTIWNINDKSSTKIMSDFYKNLSSGDNKSKALHNAKLNYLKAHNLSEKSPYYWAAFMLVGDTNTVEIQNSSILFYTSIAVVIILILYALYYKIKKVNFSG